MFRKRDTAAANGSAQNGSQQSSGENVRDSCTN